MRPLKIAIGNYGLTKALKDGSVRSNRLELQHIQVDPIIMAMRRMARGLEFDVSEMAFTTYLCARAVNKPFTAIPVFLTRGFHHRALVYNVNSGIRGPKDLEGRKVGINRGYTVKTGLWVRGILQTEYGVDLSKITWCPTDVEHVQEYQAPPNVAQDYMGKNIGDLLLSGTLDAAVGDIHLDSQVVKPLIPDPQAAGAQYYRDKGIYPINHTVVVQDKLLEKEPWLAEELFRLFKAAKEPYLKSLGSNQDPSPQDRTAMALRGHRRRRPLSLWDQG